VKLDQYTVSIIMRAVKVRHAHPRDVQRALSLLDRVTFNLCSDGVVLSIALETAVKYREVERVQFLVHKWEKSTLKPCNITCASLIKGYASLNQLDQCRRLWRQALQERGIESNDVLLGCWLETLVSNKLVDEAMAVFNEVKDRLPPNMVIYSTLAKGFAAEGRADEALAFYREVRSIPGVQLNTVLFNVLIDSQARQGHTDQVNQLLADMARDGVAQDHITFCTVVKGFCVRGDLEQALTLFDTSAAQGRTPDIAAYNTLLDGCVQHNQMELADKTLELMENSRVVPSEFTLGILVKMYGRRHQLDRAFEVAAELEAKHGLVPNTQARTCLMSACLHNKDLDRAVQVFQQIKEVGVDARAYAVLISGFLRLGLVDRAVEAVEEAYGLAGSRRTLHLKQHLSGDVLERLFQNIRQQGLQDTFGVPLLEKLRGVGAPLQASALTAMLSSKAAAASGGWGRQGGAGGQGGYQGRGGWQR